MTAVLENIWPVHSVAWLFCAFFGVAVGALLRHATGSVFLNSLILLLILLSMTFAVGRGIGMALDLTPEHLSSLSNLSDFWREGRNNSWISDGRLSEVLCSTGVGMVISLAFGLLMFSTARREN